jgi:hypothetical protein
VTDSRSGYGCRPIRSLMPRAGRSVRPTSGYSSRHTQDMAPNETPFLDAVVRAKDGTASQAAYNAVLGGVGNNHQGTLYPEAEHAVEPLLAIAVATPGWPANTALNVLTEMIGSFQSAEPVPGRDAPDPEMKQRMRDAVSRHRDDLVTLAQGNDAFGTAECACDLVSVLDEAQ